MFYLLIGTDEQVDRFKKYLEQSQLLEDMAKGRKDVILDKLTINEGSDFVNKSIRESGIREKTHGLVVGIEHKGERIVNPDSTYIIETGDVVWIAGNKLRLLSLQSK